MILKLKTFWRKGQIRKEKWVKMIVQWNLIQCYFICFVFPFRRSNVKSNGKIPSVKLGRKLKEWLGVTICLNDCAWTIWKNSPSYFLFFYFFNENSIYWMQLSGNDTRYHSIIWSINHYTFIIIRLWNISLILYNSQFKTITITLIQLNLWKYLHNTVKKFLSFITQ